MNKPYLIKFTTGENWEIFIGVYTVWGDSEENARQNFRLSKYFSGPKPTILSIELIIDTDPRFGSVVEHMEPCVE